MVQRPASPPTVFDRRELAELASSHPCDFEIPAKLSENAPNLEQKGPKVGQKGPNSVEWDADANVEWAKSLIMKAKKPEKGDRNNIAYRHAATLNDHAVSPEASLEVLREWNDTLDDPLPDHELQHVIRSAPTYKHDPAGVKASADPADDFSDASLDQDTLKRIGGEPKPEDLPASKRKFKPTPFNFPDPTTIPPRQWVYKPYYLRRALTLTSAMGGVGKSTLIMAESICVAAGRDLLGEFNGAHVNQDRPLNVWYWNGEDYQDELDRRFAAICQYYGLTKDDFAGRLFCDYGRLLPIKIADMHEGSVRVAKPVVKQMVEAIRDCKIDLLNLDPFVTTHNATENDTIAMEAVARTWAYIADETNCAIGIAHHTRKTGGVAATIEDSRGASALINVARVRRAVNKMTEVQAGQCGIDPKRRGFFFSVSDAFTNVAKPNEGLDFYQLESVNLGNDPVHFDGDELGVPTPFKFEKMEHVPADEIQTDAIEAAIRMKKGWRMNPQSPEWIGHAFAEGLGKDASSKPVRKQIKNLIASWFESGRLVEYTGKDGGRNSRLMVGLSADV
jgi:hypothetical protein